MKMFGEKKDNRTAKTDNSAVKGGENINNAENGKNKKHKGRGWLIALAVVLLLVGGAYLYWVISTKAPDIDKDNETTEGEAVNVSGENRKEGVFTLLVVGDDQEGYNTDTIMVMRYDSINNTANVVSIPRDTMVNYDDKTARKINAVFHSKNGGIDTLMDAVEGVTGFRPDNYIIVDTNCFVDVIDAMGGVYFDVPQDMDYEDYSDNDKDGVFEYVFEIHVKKGYQLLNGYDALGVFRYRADYAMGDIQRLDVQHGLLMAAAEQFMATKNVFKLYQVASIILDNSKTDLSYRNLQWYAKEFLGMSIKDIAINTMPTTGAFVNDVSYVKIDVDEWIEMLNSTINPIKDDMTKEDCNILVWTNPTAPGPDGQYHIDPNDLAATDGAKVYNDFPWMKDLLQAEKLRYLSD